jgi:hypothetical protein
MRADLAGSVQQALEPAHVSVWINSGDAGIRQSGFPGRQASAA